MATLCTTDESLSWRFLFCHSHVTDLRGSIHCASCWMKAQYGSLHFGQQAERKHQKSSASCFSPLLHQFTWKSLSLVLFLRPVCLIDSADMLLRDTLMQLRPLCKLHHLICKCGHFQCPALYRKPLICCFRQGKAMGLSHAALCIIIRNFDYR